jgi:electron transfer flavoprotein alpha subunit
MTMSGIWVFVERFESEVVNVSWEAIGLGRRLGDTLKQPVTAFVFGTNSAALGQQAIERGADAAIACEDDTLAEFRVEAYAALLTRLVKERQPDLILAGASTRGRDLLGAVAVDLETGLIADAIDVQASGDTVTITRPVYAGKVLAKVISNGTPQMLTIRNRAFPMPKADAARSGNVETVAAVLAEGDIVTKVVGFEAAQGSVSLADAAIIVSGGRGVGGPEGFAPLRELCATINAALGASRAAVDAGWIPYDHQVGQTGKTVSPDLYIACGISGAIQHQAGMRTSKIIVAVNKDPEAPIMKLARYAIIGDLFEVVPALNAAFKQRLG